MKKRNKKYNPNKLANHYQAQANQLHTLEMTFCVDDVNEHVDEWHEANGSADKDLAPESVAYEVYHGDLIICLKNLLIPSDQEWFFGVDSHFYNYATDEVLTVPVQFQMPLMSFEGFRFGGDVAIDRGHGLKTRWKGINDELNSILMSDAPEGYVRIRSDALLRVTTKFKSAAAYLHFKTTKSARELGNVA